MTEPLAVGRYPGISIDYHEKPYRRYLVNGEQVPSVTTAIGIVNKPALVFWAAKVTAEGAWKMVKDPSYTIPNQPWKFTGDLKARGLDHRSATNAAAGRGVDVHAVWEAWNEHKQIPNPTDYPEDRRGYLQGIAKFIMEHQPECFESEMVVGSAEHGFAGRLDTVVVLETDEGPSMLDLKTSKAVYPESHFPQLAA
jgi:hypothetical protein